MTFAFDPPDPVSLAIQGEEARFPVRRIFCIGRNYAEHAREMGHEAPAEAPFWFTKPADAAFDASEADEATIPYPPRTDDLHHEVELTVALGSGGRDIEPGAALEHVFGYAASIDLTRRDRQREAKECGAPWDEAKAFDLSAPMGPLGRAEVATDLDLDAARIFLAVDEEVRQDGSLGDMISKVPDLIALLSRSVELKAGDLVMTGTPAGVGPVKPGETLRASITGLPDCVVTVG